MKIKVSLSDAGLKQAEEDIRKYKTTLNQKAQLFAKALADKGLAVATIRFANAQYAGKNDVKCEVSQNGTSCTILASTAHTAKKTASTSAGTTTVNLAMLVRLSKKWTAKVN